MYWVDYGRALSRLRGRRDDAALALRRAEVISPNYVHRDPLARATLGELLVRARQDAVGRELRGMASRAGLPGNGLALRSSASLLPAQTSHSNHRKGA